MGTELTSLVSALKSGNAAQSQSAAEELSRLAELAQPAAVALVEACAIDEDETRELVVAALEGLGPPQPSDTPRLAALVGSDSLDVAYWAATLLGRLGNQAAQAVPALSRALTQHAEMSVRQRAAWALGQIGPAASGARAALEQASQSPDKRLANLAKEALGQL